MPANVPSDTNRLPIESTAIPNNFLKCPNRSPATSLPIEPVPLNVVSRIPADVNFVIF